MPNQPPEFYSQTHASLCILSYEPIILGFLVYDRTAQSIQQDRNKRGCLSKVEGTDFTVIL